MRMLSILLIVVLASNVHAARTIQWRAWLAINGHDSGAVEFVGSIDAGTIVDTPVRETWPPGVAIPSAAELPSVTESPVLIAQAKAAARIAAAGPFARAIQRSLLRAGRTLPTTVIAELGFASAAAEGGRLTDEGNIALLSALATYQVAAANGITEQDINDAYTAVK